MSDTKPSPPSSGGDRYVDWQTYQADEHDSAIQDGIDGPGLGTRAVAILPEETPTNIPSTSWKYTALKVGAVVVGLAAIGFLAFMLAGEVPDIKGIDQASAPHDIEILNAAALGSAFTIAIGTGAGIDLAIPYYKAWRENVAKGKAANTHENVESDSEPDDSDDEDYNSGSRSFHDTSYSQSSDTSTAENIIVDEDFLKLQTPEGTSQASEPPEDL